LSASALWLKVRDDGQNRVDLCSLHVPCRQHPSDTDSLDTVTTEFVDSLEGGERLVRKSKNKPKLELDGEDLSVVIDGLRIAKRGRPGTQAAKAWIPLRLGWSVVDMENGQI